MVGWYMDIQSNLLKEIPRTSSTSTITQSITLNFRFSLRTFSFLILNNAETLQENLHFVCVSRTKRKLYENRIWRELSKIEFFF